MDEKPVLVSGATGYVGGRLVPLLLDSGRRVRVMGRSLDKMACRPWAAPPRIELVQADMLDASSLEKAARGCWAAFYLIHSMKVRKDFAQTDRKAAQNMVHAAQRAGLSRIIYLGGLGKDDPSLSEHLRSRTEVARILQSGPVPVTFLRAAVILGAGSASFEMMRYLVDRLPVMTTPRWVHTPRGAGNRGRDLRYRRTRRVDIRRSVEDLRLRGRSSQAMDHPRPRADPQTECLLGPPGDPHPLIHGPPPDSGASKSGGV